MDSDSEHDVDDYEAARRRNIDENRRLLASLGMTLVQSKPPPPPILPPQKRPQATRVKPREREEVRAAQVKPFTKRQLALLENAGISPLEAARPQYLDRIIRRKPSAAAAAAASSSSSSSTPVAKPQRAAQRRRSPPAPAPARPAQNMREEYARVFPRSALLPYFTPDLGFAVPAAVLGAQQAGHARVEVLVARAELMRVLDQLDARETDLGRWSVKLPKRVRVAVGLMEEAVERCLDALELAFERAHGRSMREVLEEEDEKARLESVRAREEVMEERRRKAEEDKRRRRESKIAAQLASGAPAPVSARVAARLDGKRPRGRPRTAVPIKEQSKREPVMKRAKV